MKKIVITIITSLLVATASFGQSHSNRIDFGIGALYERGLDATLAWEHETKYHNVWEYFLNGYIKWDFFRNNIGFLWFKKFNFNFVIFFNFI